MAKNIDGPSLAIVGAGGILIYAGIRNYSVLSVIQNLVSGKPITNGINPDAYPLTAPSTDANIPDPNPDANSGGATSGPTLSGNQQIGHDLAGGYGWQDSANWTALVQLWNRESSWDNHARNPNSGAYGIPQALPYTKMPKQAWPESAGGKSDPTYQINWGLEYIKERYGSPVAAWAHEQSQGWY